MSNTRGGSRPGAGRPRGTSRNRAPLLTRIMKTQDWLKLIEHLREVAFSSGPDSLRAADLLLRCGFGDRLASLERTPKSQDGTAESHPRSSTFRGHAAAQTSGSSLEEQILGALSQPGVKQVIWNSRIGRLSIARAELDTAPGNNQTTPRPDFPTNSQKTQE